MANTFQNIAKQAMSALQKANIDSAQTDVRILLAYAAKCTQSDLIVAAYDDVPTHVLNDFKSYIDRRIAHEPIAYIIGTKEFWSLSYTVNKHVLIPRPETEDLVAHTLVLMKSMRAPKIIDVGTGSGAILISLLSERKGAYGLGVDISLEALAIARQNAHNLGVVDRCGFLCSDYLTAVSGTYDILVANPPYITSVAMEGLAHDVKLYEPSLALHGGVDGLDPYRRILKHASRVLKANGYVVFEIGYDQGEPIQALLKTAGYSEIKLLTDLNGLARVVSGKILGF